jgi:hypothetical protein
MREFAGLVDYRDRTDHGFRPRGGQGSPGTPPDEAEEVMEKSAPKTEHARPAAQRIEVETPKSDRRETPPTEAHSAKRRKNTATTFTPLSPGLTPEDLSSRSTESLVKSWATNPISAFPALSTHLLEVYFQHVPESGYALFPREPFLSWIRSSVEKSPDDLMLIYSILGIASVFSKQPDARRQGKDFTAVALYATEHCQNTLQLVQSRLLLAIYYWAVDGAGVHTWDLATRALSAASTLSLNLELSSKAKPGPVPFNLTQAGYEECRRRTFWSCYLIDRFNGFCDNHLSHISPLDIFLRLPLSDSAFYAQKTNTNPFFEMDVSPSADLHDVGIMGYMLQLSSIWGDVTSYLYRWSHRPDSMTPVSSNIHESFYQSATTRLHAWKSSLPVAFSRSPENLHKLAESGSLGTWTTMMALWHTSLMKLNRYLPSTSASVQAQLRNTREHAEAIVEISSWLLLHIRTMTSEGKGDMDFSSPYTGYAILSALDVLTSKGDVADLDQDLQTLVAPTTILDELSRYWKVARDQDLTVTRRLNELNNMLAAAEGTREEGRDIEGTWEMESSLEKNFLGGNDIVYTSGLDAWKAVSTRA